MLGNFADVCARHLGHDHRHAPGAGAAGGLGFAAKAFLQAHFRPGVDIVAELGGLAQAIEGATLVFTGEGRMDAQTLRGKTPAGVARIDPELPPHNTSSGTEMLSDTFHWGGRAPPRV